MLCVQVCVADVCPNTSHPAQGDSSQPRSPDGSQAECILRAGDPDPCQGEAHHVAMDRTVDQAV